MAYENVVIYGSGVAGQHMLLRLLQHNVKVLCLADSDPERCDKKFMNIPIVHINKLTPLCETAAMIVCGKYAFDVARELEKRGFLHLFFDWGNDAEVIHLKRED